MSYVQQYHGVISKGSPTQITKDSRFNVGSLAKEIPALLIYEMIKDGSLSFDNKISDFLDYLPNWSQNISIEDLLFYQSGLPEISFKNSMNDVTAIEELQQVEKLNFKPGSDYYYSNYNNLVLSKIVEQITGIDFRKYVREKFLSPLGMDNSFYANTLPNEHKNITRSHSDLFGDDIENNPNFKNFALCYAPLYMTIEDALKLIEFVRLKYRTDNNPNSEIMFRPTTVDAPGPLGVIKDSDGQIKEHVHGGYAYSFGTSTYLHYDSGIAIIIMTNANRNGLLGKFNDKIMDLITNCKL